MKSIVTLSPYRALASQSVCCATLTLGLALLVLPSEEAKAGLILFDELSGQPVNGLTFQGVTFGFTIGGNASSDARFNSLALGTNTTLGLQSPTLEGNATGVLTLDFAAPLSALSFNLARLTNLSLPGATVSLFDSGLNQIGTSSVMVTNSVTFSEGSFSYNGPAVQRAVLSFPSAAGPRFAIDNLGFTAAPPIPEPGTMMVGMLLAAFCGCGRRRTRQVAS